MALSNYSSALAAGDSSDASSPVLHEALSIEDEYALLDNRDYVGGSRKPEPQAQPRRDNQL